MLKINRNIEGSTAYYALEGRLDAISSPVFDQDLEEHLIGITNLVLDVARLEYISSAGMRPLVHAEYLMNEKGRIKVVNVSPVLMELFEATGFTEILTFE